MTDLETRVRRFVAEQLSVPAHALSDSTTLFGDLGVDGDDAVELLRAFGEAFDVDLEGLDPARHFGPEGWWPWAPAEWLRQATRGGTREARAGLDPLTLGDLIRVAASGPPGPRRSGSGGRGLDGDAASDGQENEHDDGGLPPT